MKQSSISLEYFLKKAYLLEGKEVVKVIEEVLEASNIFFFSELLKIPSIQKLKGTENEPYLDILYIFCYGSYKDYQERKLFLPYLSENQVYKLKKLSLISLSKNFKNLMYSDLLLYFDLSDYKELEKLLIDCIYSSLLSGKFDSKNKCFCVEYTCGRDISFSNIDELINKLSLWSENCTDVLNKLEYRVKIIKDEIFSKKSLEDYQKFIHQKMENIETQEKGTYKGKGVDTTHYNPMEMDEMHIDDNISLWKNIFFK
ncbi:hypothetical protein PNEG_00868 [Pneumocystis murina B123]|uniref:PCI domain-containing protein n=1 Tax=Pneumocystis murina (strain B123) TaxID=1069680 RepID=M7NPT4_PNEMU|nr:hypothetical protein PNEG_00868 [Pneumocystis murina B123]EMR10718.1 hypothetical protein PNEG_00868 [Pneumocystis murina B123]